MASRYRPLPVHSGSARALCLGSVAQGCTYKHREIRMHMALVHCGFLSLIHSFQGVETSAENCSNACGMAITFN